MLTTKGLVLGKPEGHHGIKIRNMSQMATSSKNDPIGLRNSSQDGNGPKGKGKMRRHTNEKIKKRIILIQASSLINNHS